MKRESGGFVKRVVSARIPRMLSQKDKRAAAHAPLKIGMISLGCPKTLVDSEIILGKLDPSQYQITPNLPGTDIALINTCSFIKDAQQESIDRILELLEQKRQKKLKAVVVMGCLVQEFPDELKKQLKEVDAFIGSGDYQKIPEILEKVTRHEKVFEVNRPGYLPTSGDVRVALTPRYYRYLKISEGCDHVCTFCTIPIFRGKHRSRPISDIVQEAKRLASEGTKELILTGQDTSYYGRDFSGEYLLPELLTELNQVEGLEWIRLMYVYPSCITDRLIDTLREADRVCKYLDMPLQHGSDRMLSAMKRGITRRRTIERVKQLRSRVPGLSIRTTFIVGFPGETEKDFQDLLDFMSEMKFERVGIFKYSREEGTPSAELPDQVSEAVKELRFQQAMIHQQSISRTNQEKKKGKKIKVLIESGPTKSQNFWVGRSEHDAPEIDGNVFVKTKRKLEIGQFYQVKVTGAQEYDLEASL